MKSKVRGIDVGSLFRSGFQIGLIFCLIEVSGISEVFPQSTSPGDWSRVLEAANKEGKVVAGIPTSPELRTGIEKAMAEKFKGIQLELVTGPATALANRIVSEHKAGVRNFDLFIAGSGVQLGVVAEGAVEPLEPYLILPEVKNPKHWFGGHIWADNKNTKRFVYSFQAYITEPGWTNSDLVKADEIRSYDDLLNPKWKSKIGFHDPRRAGAGQALWIYLWRVKGESYLKKLVEHGPFITADLRQLAEHLAKTRIAIALGPGYRVVAPFAQAGLQLKPLPIPKEGIHASGGVGAITVMKNPPHPNAAKIFVNWLLSKEGQDLFGRATGQATRRLDVNTMWLAEVGIQAAKDVLTVEEYLNRESGFEDKRPLRGPAEELAQRLLK